jgi:hypothetical protein
MKSTGLAGMVIIAVASAQAGSPMRAEYDDETGRALISDAGKPVLVYNYKTVPIPEGMTESKYGKPRSDYIHPLYGPDGQELTLDWSKDHPHHRGIYWAWPEVGFQGELGDLHALQRVWARPTGSIQTREGDGWAEVEGESRWMWEDKAPIVREVATIRAWTSGAHGRHIDLEFRFEALEDGVTLARRGTNAYGGLNIRLAPVKGMTLVHHLDPESAARRMAWQAVTGVWKGSEQPLAMAVVEKADNPDYPGDYIDYPELPWFQPTFPRAGTRFTLEKGKALTLRYRIWIRRGAPPGEDEVRDEWMAYHPKPERKTQ